MNIAEIKELVKIIDESSLTTFEMEQDGVKVTMKKGGMVPPPPMHGQMPPHQPMMGNMPQQMPVMPQMAAPAANVEVKVEENVKETVKEAPAGKTINSPMVGTFYASSAPDKPAYVKVGDRVKKGQVVCIVEAMKLMNEIESDVDGEIVEILVNNEDMVEYGQPMFVIR